MCIQQQQGVCVKIATCNFMYRQASKVRIGCPQILSRKSPEQEYYLPCKRIKLFALDQVEIGHFHWNSRLYNFFWRHVGTSSNKSRSTFYTALRVIINRLDTEMLIMIMRISVKRRRFPRPVGVRTRCFMFYYSYSTRFLTYSLSSKVTLRLPQRDHKSE